MCQRVNNRIGKVRAELHPIPVSKEVWKQIGIDIIAKLLAQHTGDGKYRKVDLTYCDVVDTVDDGSIIEGGNVTVGDTVDDGNSILVMVSIEKST